MGRAGRAVCAVGLVAVLAAATPALARDEGPEREARRHELRQQLRAERERWLAEGRRPGGPWGPPAGLPGAMSGARPADPAHFQGPGYGPAPGPGGWGGGHRLSPDERRELRQTLRQHRP
jgi:hypothetical protein